MSEIKKKFAKSAIAYQNGMKEGLEMTAGIAPVFLAVVIGGVSGIAGTTIVDNFKPLEDAPQIGQEKALSQYKTLLEQTQQTHNKLTLAKKESSFAPNTLNRVLNLQEDTGKKINISALQSVYNQQLDDFVTSALIDKRLNEADIKTIITKFETEHGNVQDVTSFSSPIDYNDINEARNYVGSADSEYGKAKNINNRAAETHEFEAFKYVSGGVTILPFLMMILIASSRKTLNNWAEGKTKPRNPNKHNH